MLQLDHTQLPAYLSKEAGRRERPQALFGIHPTLYRAIEGHVLHECNLMQGDFVVADLRQIFAAKEKALIDGYRNAVFQQLYEMETVEVHKYKEEENWSFWDEDDEATTEFYENIGFGSSETELNLNKLQVMGSSRPHNHQQSEKRPYELRAEKWNQFAENRGFPYAIAHDNRYWGYGDMPADFLIHVCRILTEKYKWSVLCTEAGLSYWRANASERLARLIETEFVVVDLSGGLSPIENRLEDALKRAGIDYRAQYPIATCSGHYRVDFLIHSERIDLVVECDGQNWHSSESALIHDRRRQKAIESEGYVVIRFSGSEIWNKPDQCIAQVKKYLH